MILNHLFTSD